MKKHASLFLTASLFVLTGYSQNDAPSGGFNYNSFSVQQPKITPELETLTASEFKSHPEYGMLPYNAPCQDCFELLQKRDESHRYFVKEGTNGNQFYAQSSYGQQSYRDAAGVLRTIDPRMAPVNAPGVFKAGNQEFPVTINLPEKFTSILNAGKELQVNRNLNIYIKHNDGSVTSLGQPSWSDYTAGDDGIMIHNFYPGIDLELRMGRGSIESFYHINKPLNLSDGWLVITDNIKLPDGFVYDYSYSGKNEKGLYEGALCINDAAGTRYFAIGNPAAYDINNEPDHLLPLQYGIGENNAYDLYMPVSWMNDAKRVYPVIIDPFVTATSTLPKALIKGSGYDAVCFQNGCSYVLPVVVPPACTVVDIRYSFNYRAGGTCTLNKAAWDLAYKGCHGPINTCNINLPGLCILQNLTCFSSFAACVPPPQCPTYNMDFTLTFYRCQQPGAGCGFSCVSADTPWDMTVVGRTVEVTTADATVCDGFSANLTANATWGAPPYTYTWNPGGLNGQTVSVSPLLNTTYTVTVSVCSGVDKDSAKAKANVTVIPNYNPGFTINPNPACVGSPVAITGLGAGVPADYSWTLNGGNPNVVNGQKSFNVTYNTRGTYDITLHYTNGNCTFDRTQQITFQPPINVVAGVDATICLGQSAQMNAVAAGGNDGPYTYTWSTNDPGDKITVTPTTTTIYTVTATDGCTVSLPSNPVTITVQPPLPADFSFDPTKPTEYLRTVQFTDKSAGAVTWLWDFDDKGATDNVQNPVHTFSGVGKYNVTLTITDANGCTGMVTKTIEVLNEYFFYIPNSFTPNGDGVNDYFAPEGTHELVYDMTIYNRWGEKIFTTSNSAFPWDGHVVGSNMVSQTGVYTYSVTFRNSQYTDKQVVGSVTLIR